MKVLSVRQPWAWAIAAGIKPVENRSRATPYRGLLAIQAGVLGDEVGYRDPLILDAQDAWLADHPEVSGNYPWNRAGKILAVAELTDVCEAAYRQTPGHVDAVCDCGPWAQLGQKHWRLADARPLAEPLGWIGALWLQDVSTVDEAEILRRVTG